MRPSDASLDIAIGPPLAAHEEIDIEIRRLVYLLNQWPGIRTLTSCAGHGDELGWGITEAYVCFTVANQRTLRRLVDAIPNWGSHARFTGYAAMVRHVGVTVESAREMPNLSRKAPVYRLVIAGAPLFYQRAQIKAIEDAVR
jgi:hypothetical protein